MSEILFWSAVTVLTGAVVVIGACWIIVKDETVGDPSEEEIEYEMEKQRQIRAERWGNR